MLEVESGPQVPTFRNSTYLDPQVGLTRDLGTRQAWLRILERSDRVEHLHACGWVVKVVFCVHICKEVKRCGVCEISVVLFG